MKLRENFTKILVPIRYIANFFFNSLSVFVTLTGFYDLEANHSFFNIFNGLRDLSSSLGFSHVTTSSLCLARGLFFSRIKQQKAARPL